MDILWISLHNMHTKDPSSCWKAWRRNSEQLHTDILRIAAYPMSVISTLGAQHLIVYCTVSAQVTSTDCTLTDPLYCYNYMNLWTITHLYCTIQYVFVRTQHWHFYFAFINVFRLIPFRYYYCFFIGFIQRWVYI